jgi:hypothetical protein
MRAWVHADVAGFEAATQRFLRNDPFTTSVIAVVAERILAGVQPAGPEDLWLTVNDPVGEVVGVAMHTPPHHVFISRMPPQAAVALAETLAQVRPLLPGVNGEIGATSAFAAAWSARTDAGSRQVRAMRMYRLGQLEVPTGVSGRSRRADATDSELVASWFAAFHDEAQPDNPVQDGRDVTRRRITAGQVHLWTEQNDGTPVAMAAVSAPAAGVARVGPVYTPPDRRRRGYGASVTAAATGAGLDDGAAHPTSNAIYQSIGYRSDHDAEERAFIAADGSSHPRR